MVPTDFHSLSFESKVEQIVGIPNFGDHRPEGWYITKAALVDKLGGEFDDGGGAMGLRSVCEHLATPGEGLAIIEEGQFQVVVASFKEGKCPRGYRVENLGGVFTDNIARYKGDRGWRRSRLKD